MTVIVWEIDEITDTAVMPDATITEVHKSGNRVTSHPIEEGVDVSDHIIAMPDGIELECVFTNTPVEFLASLRNPADRAYELYEKLLDLKEKGYLAKILTTLREYDNMVLTSMKAPRDVKWRDSILLQLSFQRVTIAESKIVDAPTPAIERGKPKKPIGRKNTAPASREIERSTSLTLALIRLFTGGS